MVQRILASEVVEIVTDGFRDGSDIISSLRTIIA